MTVAQFDVLHQIATYEPISQSELAEKVTVTEGGISRILTRLEQEGYIERKQEWKTKWITLTNKGKEKMDEAFYHQLNFQTSLFDECLTKSEQKALYRLKTKLQKHTETKLKQQGTSYFFKKRRKEIEENLLPIEMQNKRNVK